MSKVKEMIVEAVLPAIKAVGKLEMETVLANIKAHNTPNVYKNTLESLHANFSLLKEAALKTKSKVDEGIVELILEAVNECAEADNIKLV
jgi:hypothetical protein